MSDANEVIGKWSDGQTLQIDSYATNRELINAYIIGGKIIIAITDGSKEWRGEIELPKRYQP